MLGKFKLCIFILKTNAVVPKECTNVYHMSHPRIFPHSVRLKDQTVLSGPKTVRAKDGRRVWSWFANRCCVWSEKINDIRYRKSWYVYDIQIISLLLKLFCGLSLWWGNVTKLLCCMNNTQYWKHKTKQKWYSPRKVKKLNKLNMNIQEHHG